MQLLKKGKNKYHDKIRYLKKFVYCWVSLKFYKGVSNTSYLDTRNKWHINWVWWYKLVYLIPLMNIGKHIQPNTHQKNSI